MNIDDIQLRDLVVALIVSWSLGIGFSSLLIWVINRHFRQQDVKESKMDKFIEIANENLTELRVITQVHDAEISNIKEQARADFMIKYNKHK
jgi:hypothetical protein